MRDPSDPNCGYPLPGEPIPEVPGERLWHLTPEAILRCDRCDELGYWNGHVCDHGAGAAAAERCRGLVREALKKGRGGEC